MKKIILPSQILIRVYLTCSKNLYIYFNIHKTFLKIFIINYSINFPCYNKNTCTNKIFASHNRIKVKVLDTNPLNVEVSQ